MKNKLVAVVAFIAAMMAVTSCDSTKHTREGAKADAKDIEREVRGPGHADREAIADKLEDTADEVRDLKRNK